MRIGIIGAGGMARTHAEAYAKMKGVRIAGFYGRNRMKVRATARRFKVPATTDARRILDDDAIEAVDVVVPSGLHRKFIVAALERGKHVFCETPVALTLEDADAMVRAARQFRRLFLVAQLMRFVPEYVHVRKEASSGRLGRPLLGIASRLARPYWSRQAPRPFPTYGEPILELMIFDFNYLNWLFGRPILVFADGLRGARGAADYVLATLRYPKGLGLAEGSARMPESFPFNTRLRVLLEAGFFEADFRVLRDRLSFSLHEFSRQGGGRRVRVRGGDPYVAECAYFVACVRGKADPSLLDAVHDRDALRVALAARESMERDRPVTLAW